MPKTLFDNFIIKNGTGSRKQMLQESQYHLRVVIVSQEDVFVIPRNAHLLCQIENVDVVAIVETTGPAALKNQARLFLKGFGIWQFSQLAAATISGKVINFLDALCFYKFGALRSLRSVAVVAGSKFVRVRNINDDNFTKWLQEIKPDLVVSFSAPTVFNSRLLSIPKIGCLNLHCSLLPHYAGLLPSFWALFHEEKKIGATVHIMDTKIDNGPIVGQIAIDTPENLSIYDVIVKTKKEGGHLMEDIVRKISQSFSIGKTVPNVPSEHYSWPTVEEMRVFRQKGGKLI